MSRKFVDVNGVSNTINGLVFCKPIDVDVEAFFKFAKVGEVVGTDGIITLLRFEDVFWESMKVLCFDLIYFRRHGAKIEQAQGARIRVFTFPRCKTWQVLSPVDIAVVEQVGAALWAARERVEVR